MELLNIGIISLVIAAIAMRVSLAVARKCNFYDKPDARKQHLVPTPFIGGIGLCLTLGTLILIGSYWEPAAWPGYTLGLILGVSLMLLVGVIDDRKPIRARYRFIAQIIAGLLVISLGDTIIRALGEVFVPYVLGLSFLAIPFTVIAITGLTNALNMSDGVDGLCGGYSTVILCWFAVCMFLIDDPAKGVNSIQELAPILIPTIAALLVFLVGYNYRIPGRSSATAFLGDNGSMILGLIIAWVAIRVSSGFGNYQGMPPVIAVWVVALPLFDMIACMVRRHFVEGNTPMTADRRHLHHTLMDLGLNHSQTTFALLVLSALTGLIGVVGWQSNLPEYVMFWSLFSLLVVYVVAHCRYWKQQDSKDIEPAPFRMRRNPAATASTRKPQRSY